MEKVKVAAVQAAPVFLDTEATVELVEKLVTEAAAAGAGLIVFPETFVPTYPDWIWRAKPWQDSGEYYGRLLEGSVVVPGPVTEALGRVAREAGAYLAIGVNEKESRGSTIYNTLLYFDDAGHLLGKHRKLVTTGPERLVWGYGDRSTLTVIETPFGRVGGLICWENYMPLARAAMYAQGIDIWLAPTWDTGDDWVATLRHIAREGRVHVIGCAACQHSRDVPAGMPERARCTPMPMTTGCARATRRSSRRTAACSPGRWSERQESSTRSSTPPARARGAAPWTRSVTIHGLTCSIFR